MTDSLSIAANLRDTIRRIARQEIDAARPKQRYATVVSYDRVARTCVVNFPESPSENITVLMGAIQPSAAGQVVRIEGTTRDRYITDVMGQAYVDGGSSHSHTGVFTSPAALATGDWNSYIESGFYRGTDLTNASPGLHTWRYVMVINHNNTYCVQVAFDFGAISPVRQGTMYRRTLMSGTWSPWQPLDVGQDTGWRLPAFTNGWVNYGGALPPGRYRKDANGYVHLSGLIKSGTLSTPAFTLPAGYRPSHPIHFGTISNNLFARLYVRDNGEVEPGGPGSNTWFSLDVPPFLAEL